MGLVRKLFGPSREEIWRQLSAEIGGRYVEGTFWKGDVARLKLLYELFAETLEELCRIGSAQTSAPDVKL